MPIGLLTLTCSLLSLRVHFEPSRIFVFVFLRPKDLAQDNSPDHHEKDEEIHQN